MQARRTSTTLLVALTLAVAGLGVGLIAWWRPRQAAERMGSNERSAGACLKTLATADADFRSNDRDRNTISDFWTADVCGLFRHERLIDRSIAEADARPLVPLVPAPVPKSGYFFVAMEMDDSETPPEDLRQDTDRKSGKVHHPAKFAFCAYPAEYGATGRQTFIINEGNTMYWRDNGGDPVLRWPSDEHMVHDWGLGD